MDTYFESHTAVFPVSCRLPHIFQQETSVCALMQCWMMTQITHPRLFRLTDLLYQRQIPCGANKKLSMNTQTWSLLKRNEQVNPTSSFLYSRSNLSCEQPVSHAPRILYHVPTRSTVPLSNPHIMALLWGLSERETKSIMLEQEKLHTCRAVMQQICWNCSGTVFIAAGWNTLNRTTVVHNLQHTIFLYSV